MLRITLLLTFLFETNIYAQNTFDSNTFAATQFALTARGDDNRRRECAELYTFQTMCRKSSSTDTDKDEDENKNKQANLTQGVVIGDPNGAPTRFSCESAAQYITNNCASTTNDTCNLAYTRMLEARNEMNSKCGASSESLCISKTKVLADCNDFFRDNGYDEFGEKPDIKEYLEHCPFHAQDKYKTSKEDEKELTETLKEYEDAIRDLQKDSLDDTKDYNKELAELDKEALDLEKQAKEQISEMDETLEKVKQGNASELSKIKQEISQLTAQLQKAVNTDAVTVRSKTKEHQLNAGIKCYQVGLEAARAEAARLRQGTLSRKDLNGQISSGGAVGWLKVVANNAYNECMNGGPISGGMKLAKEHEQAELQRLQVQINVMSSGIKALQEEYKQASSTLPKETQRIMQKYMDSTSQLTQQAMLKKQEKSNLMMTTQKKNLQMQTQLSQLSQKQAEVQKRLAKAKSIRSASEEIANSSSHGNQEKLESAAAALGNFQLSRLNAHDQCCPGGTSLGGKSSESVCLSKKEEAHYRSIGTDSQEE